MSSHTLRRAEAQETTPSSLITSIDAPKKSPPAPSWHADMTSKEFTRYIFASLDVIVADKELPSAAFRVAYVISQHLDKKTNKAFPGTDVIADKAGMAQSTVRAMVDKLAERGHYAVEFGSRGSGHSNKYRLTALEPTAAKTTARKQRTAAISNPRKVRTTGALDEDVKERFQAIKERTIAMNHYNHLEPGLRPGGLVDRVKQNKLTETSDASPLSPASSTVEIPLSAPVGAENHDVDRILTRNDASLTLGTPINSANSAPRDGEAVDGECDADCRATVARQSDYFHAKTHPRPDRTPAKDRHT